MSDQLPLFTENGNGRMNKSAAGLESTKPGAERLLGELIRQGFDPDCIEAAARLALILDEGAER
jgi:hypothetical protein